MYVLYQQRSFAHQVTNMFPVDVPLSREAIQSNFLYAGSTGLNKEELFSPAAHEVHVSVIIWDLKFE
jgi:hypothetical protein